MMNGVVFDEDASAGFTPHVYHCTKFFKGICLCNFQEISCKIFAQIN